MGGVSVVTAGGWGVWRVWGTHRRLNCVEIHLVERCRKAGSARYLDMRAHSVAFRLPLRHIRK